jgi:hypothetical protein
VAEDIQVRRAAVDQPDGDPGVDRVQDRALALDPEQVAPLRAFDDEALGGAGQEIGDDGVDGDPPSRDRDSGLAGGNEDRAQAALACFEIELAGRGHLPDRAIGADREDDRRVDVEVLACGGAEVGRRLAEVAQLDAVLLCQLRQARDVVEPHVQPVLEVEPVRDAALQQLLPVAGEAAALGDHADERGVRFELHALVDRGDDRDAVVAFARTLRVEDPHDRVAAVAHDAAERLAVVDVVRERLSEDQVLLL